jgi:3-oxoadipate enol-lactonase
MASLREKLEGRLAPLLIRALGMKRFAKLVVSHGAKELGKGRGDWLATLIASQDRRLMLSAWKEAMAFDTRGRLAEIRCPTLIVAGSSDEAVPIRHAQMLHDGIAGSRLVMFDGAKHTLMWTYTEAFVRVIDEFLGE